MIDRRRDLVGFWRILVIFVIIILVALSLIYFHVDKEKNLQNEIKTDQLSSIVGNKSDLLRNWHNQYYKEARFISENIPFSVYINQIIKGDNSGLDQLKDCLSQLKVNNNYENIYLIDNYGELIFSVDTVFNQIDTITLTMVDEVLASGSTQIKDFYYCPTHEKIHFEIISPVKDNNGKVTSALVFRIDPNDFIYPLVMDLRISSSTAETFLATIDGDSVRILNNLRYLDNSQLRFSVPLDNLSDPLVRSVMGQSVINNGADYTGNSCLWVSESVPGTPWYLIIKINTNEVYEALNKDIMLMLLVVLLLVLLSVLALVILFNNRKSKTFRELSEKKELLSQSRKKYKKILYSIGEGVITTDSTGMIRHMNPMAERLTGWNEMEAKGILLEEVFRIFEGDSKQQVKSLVSRIVSLERTKSLSDSTILVSKEGNELSVTYSCAPINNSKGDILGITILFSDNTEKQLRAKMQDTRLRFLEFSVNNGMKDTLVFMLNEIGSLLKSPVGLFFFYNHEEQLLTLKACSTYIKQKYEINNSRKPIKLYETGIISDIILKGKNAIINDTSFLKGDIFGMNPIESDVTTILVVPIIRNKITVGVVVLGKNNNEYSDRDIETASFLVDVSWNKVEQLEKDILLRESEERFEHLFERAPLGYQSLDENGCFLEVNSAWTDTLGYQKDEVIGKWFGDFVVPGDRELLEKRFSYFKITGSTHVEYNMIHKNGERRIISFEGRVGYRFDGSFEKTHCILQDITKKKESELKLKENERKLKSMVSNLPGFIYRCEYDTDWTMTYMSHGCKQVTGYKPEDFIENNNICFNEIIVDGFREKIYKRWDSAIGNRRSFKYEYQIITAENEIKWVFERGKGIFDAKGNLLFLEGYIEDITKRKETERELLKSEKKFRDIFSDHSAVKLIVDLRNGLIIDANKAASEFYGWSIAELNKMPYSRLNLVPLEELRMKMETVSQKRGARFELRQIKANGDIVDVECFSSRIKVDDNEFFHSIIHDITQKKIAEEELRKSEEQNRLVQEYSMDAIILGKPDGSLLSANKSACEMFGRTEEELIAIGRKGLYKESEEGLPELISKLEKEGISCGEFDLVRKGGVLFPAEVSTALFKDSKGEAYTSVIIRDLTQQKESEKELILAKVKAEESDRLKSAFLANVSHEIRTPMNGILGFIELLREPELADEEKVFYIDIVNKSGQRLLNTINDIIEISRIDAGENEIKSEEFSLEELMDYHVNFFKQQADEKGIEIAIEHETKGESAVLFVDKYKLDGILTNLIKNAIKFTEKGKISIGNYIEDNRIVFYVRDTGKGIPPERIEAIFQRFTQADDELSRNYEGSGLGLSIAKSYVKLLGGEIWVESELNKGSTFYFSILYARKPEL